MSAKEVLAGRAVVEVGTKLAIENGLKAAEARFKSFGDSFGKIGGALTGAGAAAVGGFGAVLGALAFPTKLAADMELTRAGFLTLTKSAEATDALLAKIKKAAADTPFELPDLSETARMLIAFGSSTDTVVDEMRRIGDVASGINAPITEIAELYGKARIQGRLFAEDINQLTGRGIPIIQELAKQFGVTDSEVKKLVEDGQVNFGNLEAAFVSLTSGAGMFAGGMERASQTIIGKFSTLKDSIAEVIRPLGEALLPILGSIMQGVTSLLGPIGNWIAANKQIAPLIAAIATGGVLAGMAVMGIGGAMMLVASIVPGVIAAVGVLTPVVAAIGPIFATVILPIIAAVAAATALAGGLLYLLHASGLLGEGLAFLSRVFSGLLNTVGATMGGVMAALSAGQYGLAAQILWAGLKLAFWQGADAVLEAMAYLWNNGLSMAMRFGKALGTTIYNAFMLLPRLIYAALSGGNIGQILSEVIASGMDVGGALNKQVGRSQAELDRLLAQAAQKPAAQTPVAPPPMPIMPTMPPPAPAMAAAPTPPPPATAPPVMPGLPRPAIAAAAGAAQAEADNIETLRAARERHMRTTYSSQEAAFAAERQLVDRERAFMIAKRQAEAVAAREKLAAAVQAKPEPVGGTATETAAKVEDLGTAATGSGQEMKLSSVATFSAAAVGLIGGGTDERVATNTGQTVALLRSIAKRRAAGPAFT
jgi:tape measure domain-containing protein